MTRSITAPVSFFLGGVLRHEFVHLVEGVDGGGERAVGGVHLGADGLHRFGGGTGEQLGGAAGIDEVEVVVGGGECVDGGGEAEGGDVGGVGGLAHALHEVGYGGGVRGVVQAWGVAVGGEVVGEPGGGFGFFGHGAELGGGDALGDVDEAVVAQAVFGFHFGGVAVGGVAQVAFVFDVEQACVLGAQGAMAIASAKEAVMAASRSLWSW